MSNDENGVSDKPIAVTLEDDCETSLASPESPAGAPPIDELVLFDKMMQDLSMRESPDKIPFVATNVTEEDDSATTETQINLHSDTNSDHNEDVSPRTLMGGLKNEMIADMSRMNQLEDELLADMSEAASVVTAMCEEEGDLATTTAANEENASLLTESVKDSAPNKPAVEVSKQTEELLQSLRFCDAQQRRPVLDMQSLRHSTIADPQRPGALLGQEAHGGLGPTKARRSVEYFAGVAARIRASSRESWPFTLAAAKLPRRTILSRPFSGAKDLGIAACAASVSG